MELFFIGRRLLFQIYEILCGWGCSICLFTSSRVTCLICSMTKGWFVLLKLTDINCSMVPFSYAAVMSRWLEQEYKTVISFIWLLTISWLDLTCAVAVTCRLSRRL